MAINYKRIIGNVLKKKNSRTPYIKVPVVNIS